MSREEFVRTLKSQLREDKQRSVYLPLDVAARVDALAAETGATATATMLLLIRCGLCSIGEEVPEVRP